MDEPISSTRGGTLAVLNGRSVLRLRLGAGARSATRRARDEAGHGRRDGGGAAPAARAPRRRMAEMADLLDQVPP